jgi:uncharacterized protein YyaL (SSP411 family)
MERLAARNRLQYETSPYLRQHADNPVDWFPWSDEAFRKANTEDKPVFLSIGYSSCHWCHVMERESFATADVAALLNASFVAIKVDREERPDIDQAYMAMAQAATGQGGWPLTVIMTPEGRPFFLATYLPRDSMQGRPGLLQLLSYVAERWTVPAEREQLLRAASDIVAFTRRIVAPSRGGEFDAGAWRRAFEELEADFDPANGGFGDAPKFPTPARLSYLLWYGAENRDTPALDMVSSTLDAMRLGGLYDHLGSGFHRYSVDRRWTVPHFEKMLYDQALLVDTYLEAYLLTRKPLYLSTVHDVLGYMSRRLRHPDGAFFCAEDADTQAGEGAYYLWSLNQLRQTLDAEQLGIILAAAGSTPDVLSGAAGQPLSEHEPFVLALINPAVEVAEALGLSLSRVEQVMREARDVLHEARQQREPVLVDDKVVADWNGLAIAAFARAGRVLRRREYVQVAAEAADFVLSRMLLRNVRLMHTFKDGVASVPGLLDDHASMARGLLELYQSCQQVGYLRSALALIDRMVELFADDAGGALFQTGRHAEELVLRVKPTFDGALPSGNSLAATVLAVAARITGRNDLQQAAESLCNEVGSVVAASPAQHTSLLMAYHLLTADSRVTVIAGAAAAADTEALLGAAADVYAPDNFTILVPAGADAREVEELLPVAQGHVRIGGRSTAYVCTRDACLEPVTEPSAVKGLLGRRM